MNMIIEINFVIFLRSTNHAREKKFTKVPKNQKEKIGNVLHTLFTKTMVFLTMTLSHLLQSMSLCYLTHTAIRRSKRRNEAYFSYNSSLDSFFTDKVLKDLNISTGSVFMARSFLNKKRAGYLEVQRSPRLQAHCLFIMMEKYTLSKPDLIRIC